MLRFPHARVCAACRCKNCVFVKEAFRNRRVLFYDCCRCWRDRVLEHERTCGRRLLLCAMTHALDMTCVPLPASLALPLFLFRCSSSSRSRSSLGRPEGCSTTPTNALPRSRSVGETQHISLGGVDVASFAVSWFLGKLEGSAVARGAWSWRGHCSWGAVLENSTLRSGHCPWGAVV